jgi:ureidoglycolate hydrolase
MEYKGIKELKITEISGKSIDINDGFVELWHSMSRTQITKEQALATAKLIEQAPKMLAVLIKVEKHHQGGHSSIGHELREVIKTTTK